MKSIPKKLAGRLLIAKPDLLDPNFMQSIVYLARHDEKGALGFILNRPLSVSLAEVAGGDQPIEPCFKQIPVLLGGPVGGGRLAVIVFTQSPKRRSIRALLGVPVKRIKEYVGKPGAWVRAFHGHAGWDAGQLERELREGSWEVLHPEPAAFDARFIGGLWPFLITNDNRWRALVDFIPREVERN